MAKAANANFTACFALCVILHVDAFVPLRHKRETRDKLPGVRLSFQTAPCTSMLWRSRTTSVQTSSSRVKNMKQCSLCPTGFPETRGGDSALMTMLADQFSSSEQDNRRGQRVAVITGGGKGLGLNHDPTHTQKHLQI